MNPSGRKNHFFLNHVPRVFSIERLRNREAEEHIVYTYISIIIYALNINRLNAPIKNHRVIKWIQKQDCTDVAYKRVTSDSVTPWTEAYQVPLSVRFPR